ncbi:hypothetical protein J1G18_13405 [Pseudomonas sp. MIS38]|uniref:hypothetical protein n=1 Tax=Pseudomonas sp. MIS38 TaxID=91465 RepID=UPI001CA69E49|nr:hypothetical protein [Pseudomonas sp. MIS38]MBY8958285.1 hypothetical protein [Pseudomonas sp. MIS38]
MIVDKFFDSVYDVASRYVTHWRICCFIFAMLLGADEFYRVILSEFWLEGAADFGGALIGIITKAPLWRFVVTLVMAFYAVPVVSKIIVIKILKSELQQARVLVLIDAVESAVRTVPLETASEELQLARAKAELAEKKILRHKSLLEIFTFWVGCGLMFFALGRVGYVVVLISLLWPFFCWRMVPYVLNEYIKGIYYYKQLAVRVGGGMLSGQSGIG